jgi:HK97 family phage major capsid protein
MKNDVRVLSEQMDALRIEALAIAEACKVAGRDMNDDEQARFDQITKTDLPAKEKELQRASEVESQIRALTEKNDREKRIAALQSGEDVIKHVLPTNGILPEDRQEVQKPYVRQARLRAFKTERDAYNAGMWFRAIVAREWNRPDDRIAVAHCRKNGLEITNTSQEGSGSAGGYLVPAPISSTIIDVRESVGVARQVCEIQPMTSDMLSIPKRAGGLTVYYPGELGTITDSDKTWGQVSLAAIKRAVAAKISQELVDDALINIIDNIVSEMGYALALQEDNELINGTGAASYGGVRGLLNKAGSAAVVQAASGNDTWPELTIADVTAVMAKLPDRFNRDPVWLCSSNFYWAVFARLAVQASGNNASDIQAGVNGFRFLGRRVLTTSHLPTATAAATNCAIFGQFDMAVILGDRVGIRIGRDDSTGFLSDVTTLKATARYDMNVHEFGDSSNPGAYTILKTAA